MTSKPADEVEAVGSGSVEDDFPGERACDEHTAVGGADPTEAMEGLEGSNEPVQSEGRDPGSDQDEAAPFSRSLPDQPGTIDDILIGRVRKFDITQGWVRGR